MGAQGLEVFLVDLLVRAPARGRGAAHAHDDNALGEIHRTQLGDAKEAQLKLEVRADTVRV